MNLLSLRSTVRDMTGYMADTLISDARIDAAINEALVEVFDAEQWPQFVAMANVTTTANSPTVTVPGSIAQVLDVWLSGERTLDRAGRGSAAWFEGRLGVPEQWANGATTAQVSLYPTPDSTYTVTVAYRQTPVLLASGTDVPWFPAEFHIMLAYGAAARLLVQEGDETNRAQTYSRQFMDYLARLRERLIVGPTGPTVMGRQRRVRPQAWLRGRY